MHYKQEGAVDIFIVLTSFLSFSLTCEIWLALKIKYEVFYSSEIQLQKLTADELSYFLLKLSVSYFMLDFVLFSSGVFTINEPCDEFYWLVSENVLQKPTS